MRLHFEPGRRYAYSGEGIILLQFVLETGLGLNVGDEMQRRVFDRFGMTRTSMTWRPDFADNAADGYAIDGAFKAHDRRSRPRAAGSMDTTISDFAVFLAAFSRGDGLSRKDACSVPDARRVDITGHTRQAALRRPGTDQLPGAGRARFLQGRA